MGLFGTPGERTAKRELGEAQKELDQSLRSRENGAEALRTLAKQIKNDAVIAKHGRVALYTDRVATPSGVFFLTPEVSAVVDTAGAISSRFTVTRFALMGPFALAMKKKKDQRELFLYIDAPTGQHMEPCRPDDAVRVRMFASQITNAARSSELTGDRPERLGNLRLRYENLDGPDCAWRLALAELRALEESMRDDARLPEKYSPRPDPAILAPW